MATAIAVSALALSAGTSLISFGQQRAAGQIAESEAKVQAKATELAATQREADRKERLAKNLATQTARAGASGISAFEGSPLAALQESIEAEKTATERDQFNTRLSALTTRSAGSIARKQTAARATVGLLSDAANIGISAAPLVDK